MAHELACRAPPRHRAADEGTGSHRPDRRQIDARSSEDARESHLPVVAVRAGDVIYEYGRDDERQFDFWADVSGGAGTTPAIWRTSSGTIGRKAVRSTAVDEQPPNPGTATPPSPRSEMPASAATGRNTPEFQAGAGAPAVLSPRRRRGVARNKGAVETPRRHRRAHSDQSGSVAVRSHAPRLTTRQYVPRQRPRTGGSCRAERVKFAPEGVRAIADERLHAREGVGVSRNENPTSTRRRRAIDRYGSAPGISRSSTYRPGTSAPTGEAPCCSKRLLGRDA